MKLQCYIESNGSKNATVLFLYDDSNLRSVKAL